MNQKFDGKKKKRLDGVKDEDAERRIKKNDPQIKITNLLVLTAVNYSFRKEDRK